MAMQQTTSSDTTVLQSSLLLAGVSELLPAILNSQLQQHVGITQFEYFALSQLQQSDEHKLRLKDLAACTNTSMPRMSRIASRLEDLGFVKRLKLHGPGRAVEIQVTDQGLECVRKATPVLSMTMEKQVLHSLSDAQLKELMEICTIMLADMHPGTKTAQQ
ncbi:MAG: MarR family transcriptional regulator [Bifidobacterium sp.]|jgi:DNA-binding MarR family transcriptional regulator|nr:MarR family transcriptional regulator [Bifidobacterium sp.]